MIIVETVLSSLEDEITKVATALHLSKFAQDTAYLAGALIALEWIRKGGTPPSQYKPVEMVTQA